MSLTYYYFAIKNADMLGRSVLCGSLQNKKKKTITESKCWRPNLITILKGVEVSQCLLSYL